MWKADKTKMIHKCPKCANEIDSSKRLEFCICGGRYESSFENVVNYAAENLTESGKKNVFDILDKAEKMASR